MSNYTYTKHNWEDKPSSNTPITAEKLNEIEEGIYNANENKVDKEDGKGLSTNDLTDDLITDIAASKKSAHTHSNKETLDGITNLTVDKWNTVTDKVDKVDGKGLSENDFTSALKSDYDKAVQDSHTHNNKSVIDKFSESDGQLLYSGESISGKTEIDDTQSSTETTYSSSKIEELIGEGGGGNPNALTKEVVTELPSYEDAKDNVLYLIEDTTTPVPSEEVIDDENVSSNTTYSSQKITDLLDTKVDNNDFTEHITDTDIHVTADKKTSWDGAVTNSHTHDNKIVLDKFSEDSDGNPLYDGKSISGGSINIPPKNVTNLTAVAGNEKITLKWNDPEDSIVEGVTLATWKGTLVVMKEGSAPENKDDGTTILDNTDRNKYSTTGYEVTGLENGKTYYFYLIPYTTEGIYGYSDENRISSSPIIPIMLDAITDFSYEFTSAKSLKVNWTNPDKTKTENGITANWVKTTVSLSNPSYTNTIDYVSTNYSENSCSFENISFRNETYNIGLTFIVESDLGTKTKSSKLVVFAAKIIVTTDESTLQNVHIDYTGPNTAGGFYFSYGYGETYFDREGEYTLTATDGTKTAKTTVTITYKDYENTINVSLNFLKLVSFSTATDEELTTMVEAYYNGEITLEDVKSVWSVGDERTVHLSAMDSTYVSETHREQDVQMVILDFEHDDLTNTINGKTKALVTLGQKDCLMDEECEAGTKEGNTNTEHGYMNSSNSNSGGWTSCKRRTWCNNTYFNSLPSYIQNLIKSVNKLTSEGSQSTTINTTSDKIFLTSEIEMFGSKSYSVNGEGTQYSYYTTSSNRYKYPLYTDVDVSSRYWERSPHATNSTVFCCVTESGNAGGNGASNYRDIAPNFCI